MCNKHILNHHSKKDYSINKEVKKQMWVSKESKVSKWVSKVGHQRVNECVDNTSVLVKTEITQTSISKLVLETRITF